jgi:cytochrome c556
MPNFRNLLTVAVLVMCGAALADDEATDPTVRAWQGLMRTNGAELKVLAAMANGKVAFDPAEADKARQVLLVNAAGIGADFKTAAHDEDSYAEDDIWEHWDDFIAKADALNAVVQGLDVTSLDAMRAGLDTVGRACKDCHVSYKR